MFFYSVVSNNVCQNDVCKTGSVQDRKCASFPYGDAILRAVVLMCSCATCATE